MRDGTASEAVLRRRRLLAIGVVGAAILIAIIVAVIAANGGSGGSPDTTVATPVTPQTTTEAATTTSSPAAPAEVTVPASGPLSAGDSGAEVKTLQQALKQLGLYDAAVDGDFGQGTDGRGDRLPDRPQPEAGRDRRAGDGDGDQRRAHGLRGLSRSTYAGSPRAAPDARGLGPARAEQRVLQPDALQVAASTRRDVDDREVVVAEGEELRRVG